MPYEDPDPGDPTMLVGVEMPAEEGSEMEMAYAFAEEFARLGFAEPRLLKLFSHPFYAGAYRALQVLGEEKIRSIIQETLQVWGNFRCVVQDAPAEKAVDVPLECLWPGDTRQLRVQETEDEVER